MILIQRNESPDDPLTAAEAAVILSNNSQKVVKPAYLNQLVRQGRLRIYRKLDRRTNLYRRGDVELIIVSSRGGKHIQNHSKRRNSEQKEKSVAQAVSVVLVQFGRCTTTDTSKQCQYNTSVIQSPFEAIKHVDGTDEYWLARELDMSLVKKYEHHYPPDDKRKIQLANIYPNAWYGHFRDWFQKQYLKVKFKKYLATHMLINGELPDTPKLLAKQQERQKAMQFEQHLITILNLFGKSETMLVMEAEDTGLAYYQSPNGNGITVTTTNSGYAVVNLWNLTVNKSTSHDEQVAQRFIRNIMHLLDWKNSYEQMMEQARFCYGDVQGIKPHIRKAFSDACEQVAAIESN